MHLSLQLSLLASAVLLSLAVPSRANPFSFYKRAGCAQDGYLLALQNDPAEASPFCSTYIGIPLATATIGTIIPTVYVHPEVRMPLSCHDIV
jgi:hypothetical protein